MSDKWIDQQLNILTSREHEKASSSFHYHRYEPTPYNDLYCLFAEYKPNKHGRIVDYGCGKGRLLFYVHFYQQMKAVGIELDNEILKVAKKNLQMYQKKTPVKAGDMNFVHCLAEKYPVKSIDQTFFFFNPFSIQIFIVVINNILLSYLEFPRGIDIILYYPSEDYIFFLENHTIFELKQEIKLNKKSEDERFLIYGI